MNSDAVTFTYSGVLNKGNRRFICVRFERSRGTQKDYAEGEIPKCEITKQQGFSEEEIHQMEEYLRAEKDNIIVEAKKLNSIKNLLS